MKPLIIFFSFLTFFCKAQNINIEEIYGKGLKNNLLRIIQQDSLMIDYKNIEYKYPIINKGDGKLVLIAIEELNPNEYFLKISVHRESLKKYNELDAYYYQYMYDKEKNIYYILVARDKLLIFNLLIDSFNTDRIFDNKKEKKRLKKYDALIDDGYTIQIMTISDTKIKKYGRVGYQDIYPDSNDWEYYEDILNMKID